MYFDIPRSYWKPHKSRHKALQNALMESRCNHFAMVTPVITAANEQTIAEPWFEVTVLFRFIQMIIAAQDDLNIIGICEEYQQHMTQRST